MIAVSSNTMSNLIVDFPQFQSCSADLTLTLTKAKESKRVSFSEHSQMIITTNNLSYTSKSNLWYSESDTNGFKRDSTQMIHAINSVGIERLQSRDSCIYMGLEQYLFQTSSSGSCNTFQRRRDISKAVLLEQHRQHCLGINDPYAISVVSEKESSLSRQRADLIGKIHASR